MQPYNSNGYNHYNNYLNYNSSSEDETYIQQEGSMESEDFIEIGMEEDANEIVIENDNSTEVFSDSTEEIENSNGEQSVSNKQFKIMRTKAETDFKILKAKYRHLFEHPGIKERDQNANYPDMTDIEMDTVVVKSINKETHLMTSGVGVCLVVMARANSDEYGQYMALSHSSSWTPAEELLNEISDKLESKGCSRESIEFYIVGGQLPYRDGPEVADSMEEEKQFLALSKKFNIVGVQFNIADGLGDCLSVILSKDEIVWELRQVPNNGFYLGMGS